jgi:hypothetical protein
MKRLLTFALLCSLPLLMAPRGGSPQAVKNLMPTCAATTGACPSDKYFCESSAVVYVCRTTGSPLGWTAMGVLDEAITEAKLYAADVAGDEECLTYEATDGKFYWQTCGAGGGAGTSLIQEDDTDVSSDADTLDFGSGFDLTDSPAGEVNIVLDLTEDKVALASEVAGTLPVANGGTGATTEAGARTALSVAGSGANDDITSLTGLTTALADTQGGTDNLSGFADDQVLTHNGTSWELKSVPDCTAGNQLLYTQSTNTWGCEADGASGSGTYTTMQEEGAGLGAVGSGTTINFVGSAITAAGQGAVKTVTLSQTGAGSSVVDNALVLTGGDGIAAIGALTGDKTIAVQSDDDDFLELTALSCGGSTGGAMAINSSVLEFCDSSHAIQYAALGASDGDAAAGDTATAFFDAGTLEVARGGTGATAIGSDTECLFNDSGAVGADAGCTYNKTTNEIAVDSLDTQGGCAAGANDCYDEYKCNSVAASVTAPSNGFMRVFCGGTAGSETIHVRTGGGSSDQVITLASTHTRSHYWPVTDLAYDGAQCTAVAVDIDQFSTGAASPSPKVWTMTCEDNDASYIFGTVAMPDGWDGGTVTLTAASVQAANLTGDVYFDVSMRCVQTDDQLSAAWGTSKSLTIDYDSIGTGDDYIEATTVPITPSGTCTSGGVLLSWVADMDATLTTVSAIANAHIIGFELEYTATVGD